jgi:predicted DNA-binding transcriptional regulator AlpA
MTREDNQLIEYQDPLTGAVRLTRGDANVDVAALTPEVLFIEDVARILRTSRSTIERRRRAGSFPIPELLSIDGRPRWSRQAVDRYLASTSGGLRPRPARPRRPERVN